MKYLVLFIMLLLTRVGTWAQTAGIQEAASIQSASEQRRAELRLALRALKERDANARESALEEKSPPVSRHLSFEERENLRQQLRAQRDGAWSD